MAKAIDLTGQRFGRLIAVEPTEERISHRCVVWRCLCDCGRECFVSSLNLRQGHTKSCGCFALDVRTSHGRAATGEYKSWHGMIDRCENSKHPKFARYGGRGIFACKRWHVFENFFKDMGPRPKGTSIDRINNDGNYEPGNCKWSTPTEQNNNRGLFNIKNRRFCDG